MGIAPSAMASVMRPGVTSMIFAEPCAAVVMKPACEPVYERFDGWSETTAGLTEWDHLPIAARRYLERVQALIGVSIDMVSTGPDREHTILLRHPFQA